MRFSHLTTSINYSAPGGVAATPNVTFDYDAAGNRTSMNDGLGQATYAYDTLSQMTSETRVFNGIGSYQLSYSYNYAGELTGMTNPWNVWVGYSYDNNGRLNRVHADGSIQNVTTYAYDIKYRAFGAVKSMSFGDHQSLSTSYDERMRPTSVNVSNVLGYNYNYFEHTGRVSYAQSIYDPTLDRSYNYDQVGALQFARSGAEARATFGINGQQWGQMDGPYSHQYDYDQFGNLTYRHGWGGEVQGGGAGQDSDINYYYTNNKRNDFGYDLAGNLTSDGAQSYSYDAASQQASASLSGYSLVQSYDGDGLRGAKVENGTTTYYLRSTVLGGAVVAEIDGNGGWQRGYVYAGGELMSVQQGGQLYWVHEDAVTKSKRTTDVYGGIVSTVELDPWGANTNRSANSAFQPQLFTTYTIDANGGFDAKARRYSATGRFSQPDPYGGSYDFGDPQSLNRYAYTKNDPVNHTDPSGLEMSFCGAEFSFSDCGGGGGFWGGSFGGDVARYNSEYGGMPPHVAEGLARYNSIRTTGYDPAFDRYWGDTTVTRTDAQGHVLSTQTLHNATPYQLVIAYLGAADLLRFVDGKIEAVGSGASFHVSFKFDKSSRDEILAILDNTSVFLHSLFGMSLGGEHVRDLGATSLDQITDYRSINGVLGKRSLEVAINNRTLGGYADTDRFNPYQFPLGFFGHIFGESMPHRATRIFRSATGRQ